MLSFDDDEDDDGEPESIFDRLSAEQRTTLEAEFKRQIRRKGLWRLFQRLGVGWEESIVRRAEDGSAFNKRIEQQTNYSLSRSFWIWCCMLYFFVVLPTFGWLVSVSSWLDVEAQDMSLWMYVGCPWGILIVTIVASSSAHSYSPNHLALDYQLARLRSFGVASATSNTRTAFDVWNSVQERASQTTEAMPRWKLGSTAAILSFVHIAPFVCGLLENMGDGLYNRETAIIAGHTFVSYVLASCLMFGIAGAINDYQVACSRLTVFGAVPDYLESRGSASVYLDLEYPQNIAAYSRVRQFLLRTQAAMLRKAETFFGYILALELFVSLFIFVRYGLGLKDEEETSLWELLIVADMILLSVLLFHGLSQVAQINAKQDDHPRMLAKYIFIIRNKRYQLERSGPRRLTGLNPAKAAASKPVQISLSAGKAAALPSALPTLPGELPANGNNGTAQPAANGSTVTMANDLSSYVGSQRRNLANLFPHLADQVSSQQNSKGGKFGNPKTPKRDRPSWLNSLAEEDVEPLGSGMLQRTDTMPSLERADSMPSVGGGEQDAEQRAEEEERLQMNHEVRLAQLDTCEAMAKNLFELIKAADRKLTMLGFVITRSELEKLGAVLFTLLSAVTPVIFNRAFLEYLGHNVSVYVALVLFPFVSVALLTRSSGGCAGLLHGMAEGGE